MKTLKLEDSTARTLYKTANAEFKTLLEENFGKDFFSQKITDRIKTFQDVLEALGFSSYSQVVPFGNPQTKDQVALNALAKIQAIAKVLNEGWIPNFNNNNEAKYYPYFEKTSGGWAVGDCDRNGRVAYLGSGCYYKNSELVMYVGKQFIDIYKEYLPE